MRRITPSLKLLASAQRRPGAVGDFDAAAADVDDHGRRACNIDAVDRGQVNQPGFFGARDDLCLDSSLPLDGGEKLPAVFGLADGAGGGGEDLLHLVGLGQPPEPRKRLQAHFHGLRGQGLALEAAGSQADHLLFAVDHLEGQIGPDPHHDHVNRIRTAVDGRYSHLFGK